MTAAAETIQSHRIAVTLQHAEQTTTRGVPRTITVECIVPTGANWLAAEEAARAVLADAGFARPLEWTRRKRPVYLGPVHPGDDETPALRHETEPPAGGWPSDLPAPVTRITTIPDLATGERPMFYVERQEPNGSWTVLDVFGAMEHAIEHAAQVDADTEPRRLTPFEWACRREGYTAR